MNRKTAIGLIEYSGEPDQAPVAIQYVKKDGSIGKMRIRKRRKVGEAAASQSKRKAHMMRDRGKISVIDQNTGSQKSLFIYFIIGLNRHGQTDTFEPVTHGH